MNKMELISAVATKMNVTKVESAKFLSTFFDIVSDVLQQEEKVMIIGFGSFSTAKVAARTVKNPQTGADVQVPASIKVKFAAGKKLKEHVNAEKK